ncbi:MAG TPA: HlyD family type I secretion periplasmic adaptor subunit [Dongiaceae bacterium]|nr:HlyD family type I secretion periplasmic adaptor subunit [Dongiaceae bacterium]
MIGAAIVWGRTVQIDQFVTGEGEVAPSDKVKVIQHLEGGVIATIHVRDGQAVKAGDPLVEVNLAISGTNRDEIAAKLDGLQLARARLLAEAQDSEFLPPADPAARRPDLAAAEQDSYRARKTELETRLRGAEERVRQQELAVREMTTTSAAMATDLALSRKNLEMSADLLRDGLTSKMDHLEREREVKLLEGKLATLQASVSRAKAAFAEVQRSLEEETLKFNSAVMADLGSVEQELARTQELLAEAQVQAQRRTIRSPVDGIVKNMRYHTIGGVIGPAEPIMEIVPANQDLVIEARLLPQDIGLVEVGQPVRIKVSAYDFTRFGTLPGVLSFVAADSTNDANGKPFFQAYVKPDRTYLGSAPGELPIRPGMTATVDVKTGIRSVLEYLLKPVVRLRYDAFHER